MKQLESLLVTLVAGVAIVYLVGCQPVEEQAQQASQMPAPVVSVATVINETITEWDEFTGRLEAPQTVELRPRVSGYINAVAFAEGSLVKQGDLLFEIDPRPFQAEVDRLTADLRSSKARLDLAKRDLQRAKSLKRQNAISLEQVDNRESQLQQAQAQVESTTSALAIAKLNLSFTKVTAPINGRVSRALITEGNYVTAGQSLLTSLVSIDAVHAYFDADEQTYLKYISLANQGERPSSREQRNPVYMSLANEKDFPHSGYIDFVDNQVNPSTGTIRARAVFENENGKFTPGLFARIRVIGSGRYDGILISDRAVNTDLNNKYVLVVNGENKVEYRPVRLGPKLNGLRIVRDGLNASEQIVVNGLQRVRPGMEVNPEQVSMAKPEQLERLFAQQRRVGEMLTKWRDPKPEQTVDALKVDSQNLSSSPRG